MGAEIFVRLRRYISTIRKQGADLLDALLSAFHYMAPEQIMSSREVDHRADIYALGVILYETLTGERPFQGGPGQILFAHLQHPAPDPCDIMPNLPRSLGKAVMKALAKAPQDRFQTAQDFFASMNA